MGGTFGVRRPLRFLARRLDLSEEQIASLAEIIDDLKTERAQAAVDDRRAQKLFVEAFVEESFDEDKAKAAGDQRVQSTKRVQKAISDALARIHAQLDADQRRTLAYLIRSGALSF